MTQAYWRSLAGQSDYAEKDLWESRLERPDGQKLIRRVTMGSQSGEKGQQLPFRHCSPFRTQA